MVFENKISLYVSLFKVKTKTRTKVVHKNYVMVMFRSKGLKIKNRKTSS